jgi:hypothetical protein
MILRCPKCHNKMKYESRNSIIKGKSKACVYCGKNFSVKNNIIG